MKTLPLHRPQKTVLQCLLVAALTTGSILSPTGAPIIAADTGTAVEAPVIYQSPVAGKVSIGNNSFIELKNIQMLDKTVRFTISFTNGGNSEINFVDYWVKLLSSAGTPYTISLIPADVEKKRIAPKSAETFTFYATVSEATKLSDLTFQIIHWDFTLPSYERLLGTIKLPAVYQDVTPEGSVRLMDITDIPTQASVQRVNISRTNDTYLASISLRFKNVGTKSFKLPEYQYLIRTKEGLTYPLELSNSNADDELLPKFEEDFTLRGEVSSAIEREGWELIIAEKQESTPLLPVAAFRLPDSSGGTVSNAIPMGDTYNGIIEDEPTQVKVLQAIRNASDKNTALTARINFVNQGTNPIDVPKYTFKIRTGSGLLYPATANTENIRLDPLVNKEVELKATVPNTADASGWTLVMEEAVEDGSVSDSGDIIAEFALPNDNPDSLGQGTSYKYSADDGTYNITFESMERLPWEDQDILSAGFTVKNEGTKPLPILNLQGYFLLDNNIKIEADVINKDALIALQPGSSAGTILYGKIPYTYDYSTIDIILEEKVSDGVDEGDKIVNYVGTFMTDNKVQSLPFVNIDETHSIKGAGRSAELSIRSVRTYESQDNGNLFTTLVNVKNLENRSTALPALTGYFKTQDDLMFPVQFTELSGKVSPRATATLLASAYIPETIDTTGLVLVIGEGVPGSSGEDAALDAYMNATSFGLPKEDGLKYNANEMDLFPYTVTLRRIHAQLNTVDKFIFSFDYELEKNIYVQNAGAYDHKMVIEFVDNNDSELFRQTYTLGATDSEIDDNQLEIGEHTKSYMIEDDTLLTKLQYIDDFEIHIYDEYEGVKTLIAVVEYNWSN